jgi:hypothetical protein
MREGHASRTAEHNALFRALESSRPESRRLFKDPLAFGEVSVLRELFSGAGARTPFLLFWIVGWTLGGGFAAFAWLWMLAGRERVLLRLRTLAIRREVFGLGWTREYDLAHVRNMRASSGSYDPFGWGAGARVWGLSGSVVFDYGAKSVRFAASVDEPEAVQIVRNLKTRHAFPE